MTTTSPTSFLSEIISGEDIPPGKLEYFRSRLSNRLHEIIIDEFVRLSETKKITKADLARRIGKSPAQITRWLGAPSNWTLDTVSDLALGMGCEPTLGLKSLLDSSAKTPVLQISTFEKVVPIRNGRIENDGIFSVTQRQADGPSQTSHDGVFQIKTQTCGAQFAQQRQSA